MIQKFFVLFVFLLAIMLIPCISLSKKPLDKGDKAPPWQLFDENGVLHTLEDYRGKKVVLCFYPKDETPGCTKQVCQLRDNFALLQKKGIVVFGINFDTAKSHKKFKEHHQLPFPLLHDANKKCAKAYGAVKCLGGWCFPIPSRKTFLIDEHGIIVARLDKVDVTHHAMQILKGFEH